MIRSMGKVVTIVCAVGLTVTGLAQERRSSRSDGQERTVFPKSPSVQSNATPYTALDAPIDEHSYNVGAGDIFIVNLGSSMMEPIPLTVSAQGTLTIPLVGELTVHSRSLAEAREHVLRAIRKKFQVGEASISLMTPRRILVRVRGHGMYDGTYEATAGDRVHTLLTREGIRRSYRRQDPALGEKVMEPIPILRRSITIFRNSGEQVFVDLEQFEATRSSSWNPYLQEGDEVVFSMPSPQRPSTSAGGAVRLPGTYEWKPGDRVRDLLRFARGFSSMANPDSVLLLHASGDVTVMRIGQGPAFEGSDTPVDAGDRLFVPSRFAEVTEALVTVEGEVRQSGQFPIQPGRTRFMDVIHMAGGLTNHAMVHAANVYRSQPEPGEWTLTDLTAARGNAAPEDSSYVREETEVRLFGERVVANLSQALRDPSSADNVVLQAGDRIVIPRSTGTVYVFGQVASPGHVPYRPGASVDDYLALAGGVTERSKDSDVAVIKRVSRQWFEPGETVVEEGDMVWVPRYTDRDVSYKLGLTGQIAGIVTAAATLVLLIIQISN